MFESIYKDLKYKFETGGFWIRCISISVIVFIFVNLLRGYFTFTNNGFPGSAYYDVINSISLSSYWKHNLLFIWVWVTHLFLHEGFFHLLWNMLWLYWFASIVEDLIGRKHAIFIFFESAIVGGICFILSAQFLPWYRGIEVHAQGASAAVTGLLFAAATISPNYNIRLILIGNVQLKYLAVVVLILDLIFAGQASNSGGHFAHIGGAFWGWMYVFLLRKGIAMDTVFDFLLEDKKKSIKTTVNKPNIKKTQFTKTISKEEKLDQILDKIKNKGIENLSDEEKKFLEQISNE